MDFVAWEKKFSYWFVRFLLLMGTLSIFTEFRVACPFLLGAGFMWHLVSVFDDEAVSEGIKDFVEEYAEHEDKAE